MNINNRRNYIVNPKYNNDLNINQDETTQRAVEVIKFSQPFKSHAIERRLEKSLQIRTFYMDLAPIRDLAPINDAIAYTKNTIKVLNNISKPANPIKKYTLDDITHMSKEARLAALFQSEEERLKILYKFTS